MASYWLIITIVMASGEVHHGGVLGMPKTTCEALAAAVEHLDPGAGVVEINAWCGLPPPPQPSGFRRG